MAELTPTETATPNSCCAPEQQASCCEPDAKAECCDASHGDGCGCSAGNTGEAGVSDIREQVRERYPAVARRVTTQS